MLPDFLQILFNDRRHEEDIEIIEAATEDRPGRARLVQARVGQPDPAAPNSKPLFSSRGPKFGYVAGADLISTVGPPYEATYWLEEDKDNPKKTPAGAARTAPAG